MWEDELATFGRALEKACTEHDAEHAQAEAT
jgi:hypothetical protein